MHVDAVSQGGDGSQVLAGARDVAQKGAALRITEGVSDPGNRAVEPSDRRADVINHDVELGPGPCQLVQGLRQSKAWAADMRVKRLDPLAEVAHHVAELGVAEALASD